MVTPESALWQRLDALVAARDYNSLALAVDELDADERRSVAASLRADAVRQSTGRQFRSWEDGPLLAIIGAGVLPDAKSAGKWLSGHSLSYHVPARSQWDVSEQKDVVPQVFFLLTRRGVDWLPALTTELAGRLRKDPAYHRTGENFELVKRLLVVTGQPPPVNDGFVVAWAVWQTRREEVLTDLRADPRLAALVPRLFELDEVGSFFDRSAFWPPTLAEAVALGLADRGVVLDACIARLGRKGRPGADRAYVGVLQALAPTINEMAARVPGYLLMLEMPSTVVAELAQHSMSELDDAGALGPADVLTSARSALRRREKKLVRAQLARMAAANDDRVEPLAALLVDELAHLTPDLARAALVVLGKLSAAVPADRRSELAAGVGGLPQDLAAELCRVLGTEAPPPSGVSLPTPAGSAPDGVDRIVPIADLDELVAETTMLVDWSVQPEPRRLERVLEALIGWARTDADSLRGALRPICATERFRMLQTDIGFGFGMLRGIAAVVGAAAGETAAVWPSDEPDLGRGVGAAVVKRMFVLAEALRGAVPGFPVSRPTWMSGILDPDDLLERLTRAARAHVEPWDVELEQALLRLGQLPDADRARLADEFYALGTNAGRTAGTWVSLRLPTAPLMRTAAVPQYQTDYTGMVTGEWQKLVVTVRPAGPPEPTSVIWSALTHLEPAGTTGRTADHEGALLFVPWLAPGHRDLMAAHLLGCDHTMYQSGGYVSVPMLPALADMDGSFGDATALALVYGYAADRPDARELAVQATVKMCARQVLDARVLGRILADLVVLRSVVLSRIPGPLRTVAEAGGALPVWGVLSSALPALLRAQPSPSGLGELLALSVWTAERVQAHDRVEGLVDFASRRGSSLQLVEARRLQTVLAG